MRAFPPLHISADQYLESERKADFRSEYAFGDIVAMAGGTENRTLLTTSVGRLSRNKSRDGQPHAD